MARIALLGPLSDACMRTIEGRGHALLHVTGETEVLDRLLGFSPEVVLIKEGLPRSLDILVVRTLKQDLNLSLLPIILVFASMATVSDFAWEECPVDDFFCEGASTDEILSRIDLAILRTARIGDVNPLTGLPGNTSILRRIQRILDARLPHAVVYADLDNFKPYNDRYGFSRGDEVIRLTARVLAHIVAEGARKEGFVGHVGGDDFVFTVPIEMVEEVCKRVIAEFSALVTSFFDQTDLDAGYFVGLDRQGRKETFLLTSLSLAAVPCHPGRFRHYGEVAAVAAQVKKKVKSIPGSAYFVDRRTNWMC